MKSGCFEIELLGGPADGLRITADRVPGRTIQMPSGPERAGDGWGRRRSTGTHLAEYEMLWSRYATDARGAPIVHVSYDFVGSRPAASATRARRFAHRLLRMSGLAWLERRVATRRRRLTARWLTAQWLRPTTAAAGVRVASSKPRQRLKRP